MIKAGLLRGEEAISVYSIVAISFASVLLGIVAASGNVLISFSLAAVLLFGAAVISPFLMLSVTLVMSLIVAGSLQIFFDIEKANWIACLMSLMLFISIMFSSSKSKKSDSDRFVLARSFMFLGFFGYIFSLMISAVLNFNPVNQILFGVKTYVPFWGVFAVFAFCRLNSKQIWVIFQLLLGVAALQWIFCVLELLFVVPRRHASLATVGGDVEAIVGSFGGNALNGGYTGEMASFVAMAFVASSILWQRKMLSGWPVIAVALSLLISVGLAETKIVLPLIPLMLLLALWRYPEGLSKRTMNALFISLMCVGIIGAVYANRFWTDTLFGSSDVQHAFLYSFDPDFMIDETHRGRIATLIHWWDNALLRGPLLNLLFGFGPASSSETSSILDLGSAVKIFGVGLDNNALSKLLWETGLIGTFSFVAFLLGAIAESARLAQSGKLSQTEMAMVICTKVWIFAFLLMLPYQVMMFGGVAVQFLFWLTLGIVAYLGRKAAEGADFR